MDDKELTDKIEALGVVAICLSGSDVWDRYRLVKDGSVLGGAYDVVRDPRVAMAMLNLVRAEGVHAWWSICREMMHLSDVKSLPRAIVEACCEALQTRQRGENDDGI